MLTVQQLFGASCHFLRAHSTAHVMTLLLRALSRGRRAVDGARTLSSKAYAELSVGVPKESVSGERRVALTPASGAYIRNV